MTWIGDVMLATKPPKTKAANILIMLQSIQPGDIICRKYLYYLDSIFIPGEYSHSGLVVDKHTMIHAIAEGVSTIHPVDYIKDTDGFVIMRPKYETPEKCKAAIAKAQWHFFNKTQYDFTFQNTTNRMYCHELICSCLEEAGIHIPLSEKKFGVWPFSFKKELYLANNIIDYTTKIYEF